MRTPNVELRTPNIEGEAIATAPSFDVRRSPFPTARPLTPALSPEYRGEGARRSAFVAFLVFVAIATTLRAAEPPKPEPLITVEKGTLPIILTSPHGGRTAIPDTPVRKGEGIPKFVVVRDDNTAELTEKLAGAIEKQLGGRPYVVIARFERKYADANRDAKDAYEHPNAKVHYDAFHAAVKSAVAEVRKEWGRGLLLDIHGQAVTPDAIYRGTRDGKSVADLMKREGEQAVIGDKSVFGLLTSAGYATLPLTDENGIGKETRFNGGYITDTYGSHQGTAIDAIQLEFGGALRRKDKLDKTATDTATAVAGFARAYLPAKPK